MASTARALEESSGGGGFDEAALLGAAETLSVGRFRDACHHARHASDPSSTVADEVRQVEERRLTFTTNDSGQAFVHLTLDKGGWAVCRTAIEPLARRSGEGDDRCRSRRLADALIEALAHVLDTGVLPSRGGQRPHLQVTASLETLLGLPGAPAGELEFSLPISAEMVQRIACDCTVTRVLFSGESQLLDVGRGRRLPSAPTRRAVAARDRGCRWPGCDRTACFTQPHHLRHWSRGGTTAPDNILQLCYRHHWMVHEGGWQVAFTDDGRILTIPPPPQFITIRGPAVSGTLS